MPKISIIVPVYNVERYISKCVDSILSQTFTDFEVILVNDGSTDNSGDICEKYARKDERVKVLHKKNGGLSSSRNAGIDIAQGEFIGFVDSDDYIEKDMYEVLYNDVCQEGVDISICGFYHQYKNDCYQDKYSLKKSVLSNEDAFKSSFRSGGITLSAVNKLYSRKLFKDRRFPLGRTYEDAFLIPELIINSNKISYNPIAKYYYVHRANSITSNEFKMSDFSDRIDAYRKHLQFVRGNFPNLEQEALFRYVGSYMLVFDKMNLTDKFINTEIYKRTLKEIRKNIFFTLKSPLFTNKRKLSGLLACVSPWLYRKLLRLYNKKKFEVIN